MLILLLLQGHLMQNFVSRLEIWTFSVIFWRHSRSSKDFFAFPFFKIISPHIRLNIWIPVMSLRGYFFLFFEQRLPSTIVAFLCLHQTPKAKRWCSFHTFSHPEKIRPWFRNHTREEQIFSRRKKSLVAKLLLTVGKHWELSFLILIVFA